MHKRDLHYSSCLRRNHNNDREQQMIDRYSPIYNYYSTPATSLEELKAHLIKWNGNDIQIELDTDDYTKEPISADEKINEFPTSLVDIMNAFRFVHVRNAKRNITFHIPITQLEEAQKLVMRYSRKKDLPDFYLNEKNVEVNDIFCRLKDGMVLVALFPGEAWTEPFKWKGVSYYIDVNQFDNQSTVGIEKKFTVSYSMFPGRKFVLASSLQELKAKLSKWTGEKEVKIKKGVQRVHVVPIDTDSEFNQLPMSNKDMMVITPKNDFFVIKNAKRTKTVRIPTTMELKEARKLVMKTFKKSNLPNFYYNHTYSNPLHPSFPIVNPNVVLIAIFPGEMWIDPYLNIWEKFLGFIGFVSVYKRRRRIPDQPSDLRLLKDCVKSLFIIPENPKSVGLHN